MFRWPVSFPSCISWFYSPCPFRDSRSRRILLAAAWKTSANYRESPGALPGSFRERVKIRNLWRPPKCPVEKKPTWTCITPTYLRRDSFTVGAQFLYGFSPSAKSRGWVRESPLTRVELRCHCSRDSTISRFLATVYQVCRHYIASEMENISQRGDIAEGVLNITPSSLQCLQAINTPSCRCKSMSDGDCWLFIISTVIKIQRLLISRKEIVIKRENNSRKFI